MLRINLFIWLSLIFIDCIIKIDKIWFLLLLNILYNEYLNVTWLSLIHSINKNRSYNNFSSNRGMHIYYHIRNKWNRYFFLRFRKWIVTNYPIRLNLKCGQINVGHDFFVSLFFIKDQILFGRFKRWFFLLWWIISLNN